MMDFNFGCNNVNKSECEIDIINHWNNKTLDEELQRGTELREKKVKPVHDHDLINIDIIKPPPLCTENGARKTRNCRNSNSSPKPHKRGTSPGNNLRHKRKIERNKCPLRIVELAVPTKRQCLSTWKMKANILPDIMIERLRHYVLDQRPVVPISDAIQCFKYRKNNKKRKALEKYKNIKKEQKRSIKRDNKLKLDKRDLQHFCAIFGYKISQRLLKPMNIVLSSELERIAKVVFEEITSLMLKDKSNNYEYLHSNREIQKEIASKIALWFKYIQDESYYKMLDDQLQDLEEEAGPVLDVLDDFVDNVLEICIPQVDMASETSFDNFSPIFKTPEKAVSEQDTNLDEDILNKIEDEKLEDTIYNHKNNEINNIIDDFVNDQSPERKPDSLDVDFKANDQGDDYAVKDLEQNPMDKVNIIADNENVQNFHKEGNNDDAIGNDNVKILDENLDTNNANVDNNNENMEIFDEEASINDVDVSNDNQNVKILDGKFDTNNANDDNNHETLEIFDEEINKVDADISNDNENVNILEKELDTNDANVKNKSENMENFDEEMNHNADLNNDSKNVEIYDQERNTEDANVDSEHVEVFDEEINKGDADISNDTKNVDIFEIAQDTNADNANVEIFDEERNNVSDFSEELIDGNDKKVKFAHSDIVTKSNELYKSENIPKYELDARGILKLNLVFSEPNEYLLSDVDELWPGDIDPHKLRPSESVSKSITSLGNIFETEEKSSISEQQNNLNYEETTKADMSRIGKELVALHTEEKIESKYSFDHINFKHDSIKTPAEIETEDSIEIQNNNMKTNDSNYTAASDTKITIPINKKLSLVDASTDSDTLELFIENNKIKKVFVETSTQTESNELNLTKEQNKYLKEIAVSTSIDKGVRSKLERGRKDNVEDVKIYPLKELQKTSYKLTPSKTPSWIKSNYKEISKQRKSINKCQIKKWCTDLDNGYNNLELWNDWIESTLRKIYDLKAASADNNCIAKYNKINQWINFKINVNHDAVMWMKTHEKSRKLLSSYMTVYSTNKKNSPKTIHCNCHN